MGRPGTRPWATPGRASDGEPRRPWARRHAVGTRVSQSGFRPRREVREREPRGLSPLGLEEAVRKVRSRTALDSPASTRPLDRLVALQAADGSWKLTNDLAQTLGWPDAQQLKKAWPRPLTSKADEQAAATALALIWLDRNCKPTRDEWRLLADKAREWLSRTPEGVDDWLALASDALARR